MSFFDTSAFSSTSTHSSSSTPRVIPAQVDFLTIFNPSLSSSEETEGDQIVFWATKEDLLAAHRQDLRAPGDKHDKHDSRNGRSNKSGRHASSASATTATQNDPVRGSTENQSQGPHENQEGEEESKENEKDEETNYRLRQIGLARGMVEFVKNFSNDRPVSSVETQKSRIILHELEQGWWILASIHLTRLPTAAKPPLDSPIQIPKGSRANANATVQNSSSKDTSYLPANSKQRSQDSDRVIYEYSAREVASPQLLLAQLLRAHHTFLLHQAPSLWDLYNRVGKPRFTVHLQRFWEKFLWEWDVLLHGSPAVEVYGSCMKLAGGGELGIGVGEEEWGSGEREVLEGFVARTEGCVDLIVGRYGDAPLRNEKNASTVGDSHGHGMRGQDDWLGNGEDPGPADGVVFSGVGMLSRRSLATISQWMETIFKHGEDAYGVGENPSARARPKRTTRRPGRARKSSDDSRGNKKSKSQGEPGNEQLSEQAEVHPRTRPRPQRTKTPDLRRQAIENSFLPPGIPAPLVSSVERSLDEAIAKAEVRASSRSPQGSPSRELSQEQAMGGQKDRDKGDSGSSWFNADQMAKVFSLGYGTSWTLNPKGFGNDNSKQDLAKKENTQVEEDLLLPEESPSRLAESAESRPSPSGSADETLQQLDPTPEVSDNDSSVSSKRFLQHLEISVGRFLIGLSGDLENAEFEDDENSGAESPQRSRARRIFLRTLNVQIDRIRNRARMPSFGSAVSQKSSASNHNSDADTIGPKPKTSAAASVDGPSQQSATYHEKMRVAVYVHQPFIFVFLFSLQTPNLTIPSFYRGIHHQLGPLQVPLLKRTDPELVAERIKDAMSSRTSESRKKHGQTISQLERAAAGGGNTIYDLIYDPVKITIRTSIPNIPIPIPASDQVAPKSTTVSGSWYTLGIPIGGLSSASSSPSRSPARQKGLTDKEKAAIIRAEQWSRIDALSVHQQVLSSYAATHSEFYSSAPHMASSLMATTTKSSAPPSSLLKDAEFERTIKTNRGWWILWMRVPSTIANTSQANSISSLSSSSQNGEISSNGKGTSTTVPMGGVQPQVQFQLNPATDKEAFLIRKSTDPSSSSMKTSLKSLGISSSTGGGSGSGSGSGTATSGRWLLREQPRDTSTSGGASGGGGGGGGGGSSKTGGDNVRGMGEGVGIDARKWVDGLLTLTQ